MNQINIKEYFKTEKEKLRLAVIEPPSLTIVDATDGDVGNQIYIKKKIEDFESVGWPVKIVRPKDKFDLHYLLSYGLETDLVICATGQPQSIHREQCESAIVVDVGISRLNGKIVGDFVEDENNIVGEAWSTPVPGGVGLLTRLGLMKNCLDLKVL